MRWPVTFLGRVGEVLLLQLPAGVVPWPDDGVAHEPGDSGELVLDGVAGGDTVVAQVGSLGVLYGPLGPIGTLLGRGQLLPRAGSLTLALPPSETAEGLPEPDDDTPCPCPCIPPETLEAMLRSGECPL